MVAFTAFVIGAAFGAFVARRRGGNLLDVLQYAGVWGLLLALASVIVSVYAINMNWV